MEGGYGNKKGFWTVEEDRILMNHIKEHGTGKWSRIAKLTGLKRCGKSCRLRWMNYLSPNIKRGEFSEDEEDLVIRLHKLLGNRWSLIAGRIPGRTDNQVKNYWNTHLCKKLGVHQKERAKFDGVPKTVTDEPRHSEAIGEDQQLVQVSSCDLKLASIYEDIMRDDFGSSGFCFADSGLNLYTPFFMEYFQESSLDL